MNDFIFHNPDRVYFGRNQLEYLPGRASAIRQKGFTCLRRRLYKKDGLYDKVVELLKANEIEMFELSGVNRTHRHTTANRGSRNLQKRKYR